MRGHVVGTLEVVDEPGSPSGHEPRGEVFEIPPYGRVGVLADDQRRAGVLDEDIAQPALIPRSRDDLLDLPGDLVGRTAASVSIVSSSRWIMAKLRCEVSAPDRESDSSADHGGEVGHGSPRGNVIRNNAPGEPAVSGRQSDLRERR